MVGLPPRLATTAPICCSRAGDLRARLVERVRGAVDLRLRGDARAEQPLLALELALLEGERVLRRAQLRLALAVVRLQRLDLQARRRELRRGLVDGDAERRVVEAKQHVAPLAPSWLSRTSSSTTRPATLALIATRAACT